MKRELLLFVMLIGGYMNAQDMYHQTDIVLNEEMNNIVSYVCQASRSITLKEGFCYKPVDGHDMKLSIDRYGVFLPEEGYYGGPGVGDNGVVGSLSGVYDVGDMGGVVYSIPLKMPSCIGDILPQLSVSYNSQGGNGLLGWGWNVSGLSSITRARKTIYHDGEIGDVDFNDDVYSLDGNRMFQVSEGVGSVNELIYKTEMDMMSKIVSYPDSNSPDYFEVWKADGTICEYGNTVDSKIETSHNSNLTLMWMLNKVSDRDGNYMTFHYDENQKTGEVYIKSIYYTYNDKTNQDAVYKVEFVYEEKTDCDFAFCGDAIIQSKRLLTNIIVSNMLSNSELYNYSFNYLKPQYYDNVYFMYHRLVEVTLTVDGVKLNPTRISWNDKSKHYGNAHQSYVLDKNVFNKVPFVGDFNGDGLSDVILVPYKLGETYPGNVLADVYLNTGKGGFEDFPLTTMIFDKYLEWIYVVDFNGDGKDDIVSYSVDNDNGTLTTMNMYINNGKTFDFVYNYSENNIFNIYPGDFFGERKASLLLISGNYGSLSPNTNVKYLYYKDETCFSNVVFFDDMFNEAQRFQPMDYNGDGASELLATRGKESGFYSLILYNGYYVLIKECGIDISLDDFVFPGDFNGDGNIDLLVYSPKTYWTIRFSKGNGYTDKYRCDYSSIFAGVTPQPIDRYLCSLKDLAKPTVTIRTADFDGDGTTDIGIFKNSGGNYYLEVGFKIGLKDEILFTFANYKRYYMSINYAHQYVHLGNFLGQENISVLSSVRRTPYSAETPKIVALNPHTSMYAVERITDGMGNCMGFEYDYLMPKNDSQSFYSLNAPSLENGVMCIGIPIRALKSDTLFSINGNPVISKYYYNNAKIHLDGHGFMGFESVMKEEYVNGVLNRKQITYNELSTMSENFIMLLDKLQLFGNDNVLLKEENYFYEKYSFIDNDKIIMPMMVGKTEKIFDCDKRGKLHKVVKTVNEYNSDLNSNVYLNAIILNSVTEAVDYKDVGDNPMDYMYWTKVENYYNLDYANWLINRPAMIVRKQSLKSENVFGNTEMFHYSDDNNPHRVMMRDYIPNVYGDITDPLSVSISFQYDDFGHVVQRVETSSSFKDEKVIKLDYGPEYQYRYPTLTVDEMGRNLQSCYDKNYGMLTAVTDYNDFTTNRLEDPFGVRQDVIMADGIRNVKVKLWSEGNEYAPEGASYYIWDKTTGKAETMTFYHKTGKELRNVSFNLNGDAVFVDMKYDDNGNLVKKSLPYYRGDNVDYVSFTYDIFGRLTEESRPDGTRAVYQYDGYNVVLTTYLNDGTVRKKIKKTNPMGWLIETEDNGGASVVYDYYSSGNIKSAKILGNENTVINVEYDNRGNKKRLSDPNGGVLCYEYDAADNLVKMIYPENNVTTYSYNAVGQTVRRVDKDVHTGKEIVTEWIYEDNDGEIGLLKKIICGDNQVITYNYDELLRVTSVDEMIDGEMYSTSFTYDEVGRKLEETFPSGLTIKNVYSNSGYCRSIIDVDREKVLWTANKVDSFGNIVEFETANGCVSEFSYDDLNNRLLSILTKKGDFELQNLVYSYDGNGNLTGRSKYTGTKVSEEFEYDKYDRLTKIRRNGMTTGIMQYDVLGNINSKSVDGKDIYFEAEYDTEKPNAIVKAKLGEVDIEGINHTITYTMFDKVDKIISGDNTIAFQYGFDYERCKVTSVVDGKSLEKVYVGGCEYVTENNKTTVYTYIQSPAGVFAVEVLTPEGDRGFYFIYKDHLGSWNIITDENGNKIQELSFDAWGNLRNADTWSGTYNGDMLCDRGFTGHEHLKDFGLINMNGRMYDPLMSMMLSPDNNVQLPDMSQNYNRYSYCLNNPLSYNDPTGEWIEWLVQGLCGGVFNIIKNIPNIDTFGEGLLAFGAGFIQGCVSQGVISASWIVQVMSNAAIGGLVAGTNSFIANYDGSGDYNSVNWSEVTKSFWGGVGKGLSKSTLCAYIHAPKDNEEGLRVCDFLANSHVAKHVIVQTASSFFDNLFAGKYVFQNFRPGYVGFDFSILIPIFYDVLTQHAYASDWADQQVAHFEDELRNTLSPEDRNCEIIRCIDEVVIDNGKIYVKSVMFAMLPAQIIEVVPISFSRTWTGDMNFSLFMSMFSNKQTKPFKL